MTQVGGKLHIILQYEEDLIGTPARFHNPLPYPHMTHSTTQYIPGGEEARREEMGREGRGGREEEGGGGKASDKEGILVVVLLVSVVVVVVVVVTVFFLTSCMHDLDEDYSPAHTYAFPPNIIIPQTSHHPKRMMSLELPSIMTTLTTNTLPLLLPHLHSDRLKIRSTCGSIRSSVCPSVASIRVKEEGGRPRLSIWWRKEDHLPPSSQSTPLVELAYNMLV